MDFSLEHVQLRERHEKGTGSGHRCHDTVLKRVEHGEEEAYATISGDPMLCRFLPRLHGVQDIDGDRYLELESLQAAFPEAES